MKLLLENVDYTDSFGEVHKLNVKLEKYSDGNHAISADHFDDEIGGMVPYAKFTVNIPDAKLKDGMIALKDHDENEGVLPFLYCYDIVSGPIGYIEGQYVRFPICKLLKT